MTTARRILDDRALSIVAARRGVTLDSLTWDGYIQAIREYLDACDEIQAASNSPASIETPERDITRWEYQTISFINDTRYVGVEGWMKFLNAAGVKGWEAYAVASDGIYLKRRRP